MPQGVSGHFIYVEALAKHIDLIAVAQRQVTARDILSGRAQHPRTGNRLQSFNSADVIEMMVSDQNVAQLPAGIGRQPGLDGGGITWINNRAAALLRVL